MQPYEFKQKCDLRKPIQVEAIHGVVFTADVLANKFTAEVTSNGDPVSLANATVNGYAIRDDGETVFITGSASGNTASITLPASAYVVSGSLDIVIKVTAGGVTMAVGAWRGYVQRSTTDTIVDPGHVVPSLEELLEKIADCEEATVAANSAATNANTKAGLADTAATNANTAAGKINDMTVAAATLAPGSSATAAVSEVSGHKHIAFGIPKGNPGKDFHIAKTFASISAMEAYSGAIELYDYAMIDTGSVQDVDTGKLFCWENDTTGIDNTGWHYIGDLSGAQGTKGETGNGIASTVLNNDYTLTITYTDGTTYTTTSIRGAQGATGDTGPTGATGATGPAPQIASTVTTYQESSSGSTVPSGTWQNAIPNPLTQGMFLWVKTVITYDTGDTLTQYSVSHQGLDGNGSVSTVNNISPDANGNVTLPTDSAPTQNSGNYVTSGGVWTPLDALSSKIDNPVTGLNQKAPVITENESGAIVSITDGADDLPMKSLIAHIEPVQDLHGYDNPWPAGGGVNKLDISIATPHSQTFGLTKSIDSSGYVHLDGVVDSELATMSIAVISAGVSQIDELTGKGYVISAVDVTGGTITSCWGLRNGDNGTLACGVVNPGNGTELHMKFRFVVATSAQTTFSPYSNICPISGRTGCNVVISPTLDAQDGTTYSISWQTEAGTVYGGTLNVTTGLLTVDRAQISSYNGETLPGEWISDRDVYAAGTTPTTGAQVVYELATPVTYQLTAQEVRTLLGQNNIWADTGNSSVEYFADTKLYITKVISELGS